MKISCGEEYRLLGYVLEYFMNVTLKDKETWVVHGGQSIFKAFINIFHNFLVNGV